MHSARYAAELSEGCEAHLDPRDDPGLGRRVGDHEHHRRERSSPARTTGSWRRPAAASSRAGCASTRRNSPAAAARGLSTARSSGARSARCLAHGALRGGTAGDPAGRLNGWVIRLPASSSTACTSRSSACTASSRSASSVSSSRVCDRPRLLRDEQHHGRHAGFGDAGGVVQRSARQAHVGSLKIARRSPPPTRSDRDRTESARSGTAATTPRRRAPRSAIERLRRSASARTLARTSPSS